MTLSVNKNEIFSLDDFISRWNVSVPKYWFDMLEKATGKKLKKFKKCVKKRRKDLVKKQAFSTGCNLYQVLLSSLNHELLTRSKLRKTLFLSLLPLKRDVIWFVSHKKQHYQWDKFIWYEYVDNGNLLYKPLRYHLKILGNFWLRHWKWIIGFFIAIMSLYFKFKGK
jgi:hypothetical protein